MQATAFEREVRGICKPYAKQVGEESEWFYIGPTREICGPFATSAECEAVIRGRRIHTQPPRESFEETNRKRRKNTGAAVR